MSEDFLSNKQLLTHSIAFIQIKGEKDSEEGVKAGGKLIKTLQFADDQAMVAGKEVDLQRMMDRL